MLQQCIRHLVGVIVIIVVVLPWREGACVARACICVFVCVCVRVCVYAQVYAGMCSHVDMCCCCLPLQYSTHVSLYDGFSRVRWCFVDLLARRFEGVSDPVFVFKACFVLNDSLVAPPYALLSFVSYLVLFQSSRS